MALALLGQRSGSLLRVQWQDGEYEKEVRGENSAELIELEGRSSYGLEVKRIMRRTIDNLVKWLANLLNF